MQKSVLEYSAVIPEGPGQGKSQGKAGAGGRLALESYG